MVAFCKRTVGCKSRPRVLQSVLSKVVLVCQTLYGRNYSPVQSRIRCFAHINHLYSLESAVPEPSDSAVTLNLEFDASHVSRRACHKPRVFRPRHQQTTFPEETERISFWSCGVRLDMELQ